MKRRVLHVFTSNMVANGHTFTDILRKAICMEKQRRLGLTQEAPCRWMLQEHGVTVTQGTISNVLKRSADLLGPTKSDAALHSKRQRAVSYPLVETALARWIIEYQGVFNISGHLIQEKAASFMKTLYPTVEDEDAPAFSIGWWQKFKIATASACTVALAKADLSTSKHWRGACRKSALNWTSTTPPISTTWM